MLHEEAKRSDADGRAIFADEQGLPVRISVVLTGQDPLGIDGKLAHKCRDDVDQEHWLDRAIALGNERPEFLWLDTNRGRECVDRARGVPRDDRANALDNGIDVRLVDRLRQGSAPRWTAGEKQADSSAIPMRGT